MLDIRYYSIYLSLQVIIRHRYSGVGSVSSIRAASELATNAVVHAQTPFSVRLTAQDHVIRLEVADQSSTTPVLEELGQSQRGLRIVQAVASGWGIDPTGTGKTIWAQFDLSATE